MKQSMRKTVSVFVAAALMAASISACSLTGSSDKKDKKDKDKDEGDDEAITSVVEDYLDALKDLNAKKMAKKVEDGESAVSDYELSSTQAAIVEEVLKNLDYEIGDVDADDEEATVTVTITHPDVDSIDYDDMDLDDFLDEIEDADTEEEDFDIELILDGDDWVISSKSDSKLIKHFTEIGEDIEFGTTPTETEPTEPEVTPTPTATPTPEPTAEPTAEPTSEPTDAPTPTPAGSGKPVAGPLTDDSAKEAVNAFMAALSTGDLDTASVIAGVDLRSEFDIAGSSAEFGENGEALMTQFIADYFASCKYDLTVTDSSSSQVTVELKGKIGSLRGAFDDVLKDKEISGKIFGEQLILPMLNGQSNFDQTSAMADLITAVGASLQTTTETEDITMIFTVVEGADGNLLISTTSDFAPDVDGLGDISDDQMIVVMTNACDYLLETNQIDQATYDILITSFAA